MTDAEQKMIDESKKRLMEDFNPWIAEALAERGWDFDGSSWYHCANGLKSPRSPTGKELLNEVLEWHGIIGFTGNILQAIEELF